LGQDQLIAQVRGSGQGRVQGVLEAGVQLQEVRHREQAQDLGHRRLSATEQEAGGRPVAGRVALRQLLEREADAIDRHYMHAHLQSLLYRSRDVFASALDEYDQACHQHDAEMDSIQAAFMAKWGRLPVLETYKQMAIRQQKAKNYDQALWWAERGIAIYGTDCARADAVEDLQKRAASYRAKLHPQPRPSRPRAVRPNQPEVEVLTCGTCGREFQRTRLRGRKPLHCPECRDQTG
jgi:hypothetical protein